MLAYEFKQVPTDSLLPNPFRPRFEHNRASLLALSDSLRTYGMLQPLLVAKTSAGLQIISGERRWKAAKLAGLPTVPVSIFEISTIEMVLLYIEESRHTQPLNLLEQASLLKRILAKGSISAEDLSHRLGLAEADLNKIIDVMSLPQKIKERYLNGDFTDEQLLEFEKETDHLTAVYKAKS